MRPKRKRTHDVNLPPTQRIGGSTYVFEQRVGTHGERYRACIPGKRGQRFLVHVIPRDKGTIDMIEVLRGIPVSDKDLPHIEDFSVRGDSIFVSQRWVPGHELRGFLESGHRQPTSRHRLSASEAVRLFSGFVHLLRRFNHTYRMIHGDLKPENLTIARNPNRLLLIDFGSAWTIERTTKRNPTDGVDFHYAAPELQAPNDNRPGRHPQADFRSDQFSASVVLYEMLTFERPYEGAGGIAGHPQYREMYQSKPMPPSEKSPDRDRLHPRVWKAIDDAVLTGIHLDPNARFQSFDQWLDAFKRIRIASDRAGELSSTSKAALWLANAFRKSRNLKN